MIKQKTVFVVGAGASTNFGLPSGAELKADIAGVMTYDLPDPWTVNGPFRRIFHQIKGPDGGTRIGVTDVNDALRAAREIRDAMPLAQSIDNYLDAHRHDPITNLVGKMGICQAIVEREGRSNITSPDPSNIYNQFDFSRSENTWANAFLRKLTEGVPKDQIKTLFQGVALVTFNYDRCIEQFLYYALQRYYRLGENEVVELLGALQLVHVYGKVGRLPWQTGPDTPVPYGDISNADLVAAAKGISTFTELEANVSVRAEIGAAFSGVERLVFLGFSFQEQNVDILPEATSHVDIFGTAKGMSQTNLKVIEAKLPARLKKVRTMVLESIGAEAFVDNYWRVIE